MGARPMVRRILMVLIAMSACIPSSASYAQDDAIEQIEVFTALAFKPLSMESRLETVNKRLLELQAEHTITRVTFCGTVSGPERFTATVFYKKGKPPYVERFALYEAVDRDDTHQPGLKAGQNWTNTQLAELQKKNRITRVFQSFAGEGSSNVALLVCYTEK